MLRRTAGGLRIKLQATSSKLQAPSGKLQAPSATKKT